MTDQDGLGWGEGEGGRRRGEGREGEGGDVAKMIIHILHGTGINMDCYPAIRTNLQKRISTWKIFFCMLRMVGQGGLDPYGGAGGLDPDGGAGGLDPDGGAGGPGIRES